MDATTNLYVKMHMDYLKSLSPAIRDLELSKYETLYDHMFAYLITLGLAENAAIKIIDDFRIDNLIDSVQQATF